MNKRRRYKAKRRRKETRDLLLFFDAKVLAIRSMRKIAKLQWEVTRSPQWYIPADRRKYTFIDNQWPK